MKFNKITNILAVALIAIFSVLYIRMSFENYRFFETGLDLGAYAQALFNLSHFRLPFNTFKNMVMWGDHAHFIITLLAPIYRFFPDARLLLLAQVLVVTISGYPLYKITQKLLKSSVVAVSFLYAYLAFIGTQYALNTDFHPSVLTGGIILWFIYGWHFKKMWVFWTSLFLGMTTREDAPPIFFMLAFFYFLWQLFLFVYAKLRKQIFSKKWLFFWATTMAVSFGYFCLVAYVVMPIWTKDGAVLTYLDAGDKDPYNVARGFFQYPKAIFQNMTDTELKRSTINTLFSSFGYLPAVNPFTYFTGITIFYSRFASPNDYRWAINNYSNGNILPILAVGGVYTVAFVFYLLNHFKLQRTKNFIIIMITFLLIFSVQKNAWSDKKAPLYLSREKHIMPENLISEHEKALNKAKELIPAEDTVAVSSGFAARFANRKNLQLYPEINNSTQWLVISSFVNPWPIAPGAMKHEIKVLQNDKNFSEVWYDKGTYIFKRITKENKTKVNTTKLEPEN